MSTELEQMVDRVINTDFLIIGGGLAGCMAAIQAKRKNKHMDVTLMEKSSLEVSGSAIGLKDFHIEEPGMVEHPLPDSYTLENARKALFGVDRLKGMVSIRLQYTEMINWLKPLAIMEDIGIQVREDDGYMKGVQCYRQGTVWGKLAFDENGKPYAPNMVLYRGSDLKAKLSAAVYKEGVRVLDRTMIGNIITKNGAAVGATALNMRTGELILINAKSILISTGRVTRLYPYPHVMYPQNLFYSVGFSGNSGCGVMAALNAGAKVHNMEFIWMYSVSRGSNLSSGTGGTGWFFPLMNSSGELLEKKYPDRNMMKYGGNIPPINFQYAPNCQHPEIEHDYLTSDKSNAADHEVTAVNFCAATEKPRSLKFHMMAGGVKNERPLEGLALCAGLTINGIKRENEFAETSLQNLYTAGDCAGHTAGCRALTWGWIVGDHAADRAKEMEQPTYGPDQLNQIAESKKRIFAPLNRTVNYAVNPLELEDYIRNLNAQFVGVHKIEPRLKYAVDQMRWLKEAAVPALSVSTPHELMRAVEVQDILELSEMHAYTSLMRDESRMAPIHNRDDYPEQDPKWDNKTIVATKVDGKIVYTTETVN